MASNDELLLDPSIFQEPDGYFQPEKPATYAEHTLLNGQTLRLRLVGFNPLWVQSRSPLETRSLPPAVPTNRFLLKPLGPFPLERRTSPLRIPATACGRSSPRERHLRARRWGGPPWFRGCRAGRQKRRPDGLPGPGAPGQP